MVPCARVRRPRPCPSHLLHMHHRCSRRLPFLGGPPVEEACDVLPAALLFRGQLGLRGGGGRGGGGHPQRARSVSEHPVPVQVHQHNTALRAAVAHTQKRARPAPIPWLAASVWARTLPPAMPLRGAARATAGQMPLLKSQLHRHAAPAGACSGAFKRAAQGWDRPAQHRARKAGGAVLGKREATRMTHKL